MPNGNTDNHKQIYVDYLHFLVIIIEFWVTAWVLFAHPLWNV